MRKKTIVLLGLIVGFSVLGLSPITTANAQAPTPQLNYLSLTLSGFKMTMELDMPMFYAVVIIQNNIIFAWGCVKDSMLLPALGNAWISTFGLSKLVEGLESPYYLLSATNLKSVGSIFPGVLEVYNDSKYTEYQNQACDTHLWGVGSNVSEVEYYLHLESASSASEIPLDPSPLPFFNWEFNSGFEDITYTFGINYTGVNVRVIDANNWTSLVWNDPIATETMDYVAITYELDFDTDGTIQLSQNLYFGDITETGVSFDGLGLSVPQFNFANTLSFDLSANVKAKNETGDIVSDPDNTTVFQKANIIVGFSNLLSLDLASTKENYTLGGTENHSVVATSIPWYTATYEGNIVDQTYQHQVGWKSVTTAFQNRICYPTWNGSKIEHDPIFGMTSPAPLLLSFNIKPNGWLPSAIIGGVIGVIAVIVLISAIVVHRKEKY